MTVREKGSRKRGDNRGTGIPNDPASVQKALDEIRSAGTVDVFVMSTALGIGKNVGYRQAQEGRFGAFKVGAQFRVPTAPLREALRLSPAAPSSDQVAA